MYSGYRTIFWGLFFCIFHINLGPIPILPAFVGWLIVAGGVSILNSEQTNIDFSLSKHFALIVAGISFLGMFAGFYGITDGIFAYSSILIQIVTLLFVYYLLGGSIEYLRFSELFEEVEYYIKTQRYFVIIYIIITILACIMRTTADISLSMLVTAAAVIQFIWLMIIVSSFKSLYSQEPPNDYQGIR